MSLSTRVTSPTLDTAVPATEIHAIYRFRKETLKKEEGEKSKEKKMDICHLRLDFLYAPPPLLCLGLNLWGRRRQKNRGKKKDGPLPPAP